jgi:hypothetical protein
MGGLLLRVESPTIKRAGSCEFVARSAGVFESSTTGRSSSTAQEAGGRRFRRMRPRARELGMSWKECLAFTG